MRAPLEFVQADTNATPRNRNGQSAVRILPNYSALAIVRVIALLYV